MGVRAPTRFKVYRPRLYEEDFYNYTGARGTTFLDNGETFHWTLRLRPF